MCPIKRRTAKVSYFLIFFNYLCSVKAFETPLTSSKPRGVSPNLSSERQPSDHTLAPSESPHMWSSRSNSEGRLRPGSAPLDHMDGSASFDRGAIRETCWLCLPFLRVPLYSGAYFEATRGAIPPLLLLLRRREEPLLCLFFFGDFWRYVELHFSLPPLMDPVWSTSHGAMS